MFESCVFPEGFSLGDKFDTSNVTDMAGMFAKAKLPEDFFLGENLLLRQQQILIICFIVWNFQKDFR